MVKPETEFSLLDRKQSLKGYKQKKRKVGGPKQNAKRTRIVCVLWSLYHIICVYSNQVVGLAGGTGLGPSCECEPRPGTTSGWWSVVLVLVLSVSALWYPTDFGQGTWVGQELRAPFVWHDCANTISYRAERESVNSSMEPEAGTETAN